MSSSSDRPSTSTSEETSGQLTPATTDGASRSLTEVARSIEAFQWNRPLPSYVAPTSRGSIPHLTPDNLHSHTKIPSVHIGLEDFITPPPSNSALLQIPTTLQQYLAYPDSTQVIFSARKANPVPVNASWDNKIEINTIDGRNSLTIEMFVDAVKKVKLRDRDVVVSIPDSTESPGVKRLAKMVSRTEKWLEVLLSSNVQPPNLLVEVDVACV